MSWGEGGDTMPPMVWIIDCCRCGYYFEGDGNLRQLARKVIDHDNDCDQLTDWEAGILREMRLAGRAVLGRQHAAIV